MLYMRVTLVKLAMLLAVPAAVLALPVALAQTEAGPVVSDSATDGRKEVAPAGPALAMSAQEQTSAPGAQADGDGPDILKTALLTLAGVGGGAAFFTLAYLIRRRIGFDLHLPPEDSEETGH